MVGLALVTIADSSLHSWPATSTTIAIDTTSDAVSSPGSTQFTSSLLIRSSAGSACRAATSMTRPCSGKNASVLARHAEQRTANASTRSTGQGPASRR